MTEHTHTPGPWNLEPRRGGDKEIIVRQDADGWERLYCEVDCDDCDIATAEANARLIAAAPDLLEAGLELADAEQTYRLAHDLYGDGSKEAGRAWDLMRRAGDNLRAAITKATPEDRS